FDLHELDSPKPKISSWPVSAERVPATHKLGGVGLAHSPNPFVRLRVDGWPVRPSLRYGPTGHDGYWSEGLNPSISVQSQASRGFSRTRHTTQRAPGAPPATRYLRDGTRDTQARSLW